MSDIPEWLDEVINGKQKPTEELSISACINIMEKIIKEKGQ